MLLHSCIWNNSLPFVRPVCGRFSRAHIVSPVVRYPREVARLPLLALGSFGMRSPNIPERWPAMASMFSPRPHRIFGSCAQTPGRYYLPGIEPTNKIKWFIKNTRFRKFPQLRWARKSNAIPTITPCTLWFTYFEWIDIDIIHIHEISRFVLRRTFAAFGKRMALFAIKIKSWHLVFWKKSPLHSSLVWNVQRNVIICT